MTCSSDGLFLGFDAAYPPAKAPAAYRFVLGYIGRGGLDNNDHSWTPAEWLPFGGLGQFPCWEVRFAVSPADTANAAAAAARALGWAPSPDGPRVIVYSFETTTDAAYWAQLDEATAETGFTAVLYGSLSTVLGNKAAHVWVADWDSEEDLPGGVTVHGHQFDADIQLAGAVVDVDVVDGWLWDRAGRGRRTQ